MAADKNQTDNPDKMVNDGKVTRRSMQAPAFTVACCFGEGEGEEELIQCRILELDEIVRKMAPTLEDSKVLAKLAAWDVCAEKLLTIKIASLTFIIGTEKPKSLEH